MKTKICFISLFLFYSSISFGQINDYDYKRELKGITNTWQNFFLPDEIFGKVNRNLSDIRIIGFTESDDTVEVPFILRVITDQFVHTDIQFNLINQTRNNLGYYFTYEIPDNRKINQLNLEFKLPNFDWEIILEGSQDQQDWYTILEDYRILSIKNENMNYSFTTLDFSNVKYNYLRLFIPGNTKPYLHTTKISDKEIIPGEYREFQIKSSKQWEDKKLQQTIIKLDLPIPVPVSYLKLEVEDTYDYYRPITIQYLTDSTDTPKGWKYYYSTIYSGILSSLEDNTFKFQNTITRELKIIINNYDNEPLLLRSFIVKGNVYELTGRFSEPGKYYLIYGNKKAVNPSYDIQKFKDKIPKNLKKISFGDEEKIAKDKEPEIRPLFENKIWLWTTIIIIILILGWFALRMIRKTE
jgi:hypothetical protein